MNTTLNVALLSPSTCFSHRPWTDPEVLPSGSCSLLSTQKNSASPQTKLYSTRSPTGSPGALRCAPSARPWRHGSHALLLDADSEWSTSRRFAERALYAHIAPQSAHNQSFETRPQSAQNNNFARNTVLCTVGCKKIQVFSAKVQIMHLWLITQRS